MSAHEWRLASLNALMPDAFDASKGGALHCSASFRPQHDSAQTPAEDASTAHVWAAPLATRGWQAEREKKALSLVAPHSSAVA
jgi:hypothetical protein